MEHRRFGRTKLSVPALTFGGGWVGGVLIHHGPDIAHKALDHALAAGIDWIDTAADYGKGVSETVIGAWLANREVNERPGLSTKFRLDPTAGDLRGQMLRSVEASLGRLGTAHVPVIILHNQVDVEGHRGARSLDAATALHVADMMEDLRDQGLCDWLGMTGLGDPNAIKRVVGSGRFDVAQVYYNMLNPTAACGRRPWNSTDFAGLLATCAEHDMGVMGIRVYAGGHLATTERTGREIPVTDASGDQAEEARARVIWQTLTAADGTHAQAAVRFALAQQMLSTVVVGLNTLDHLDQAIAAARMGPLPADRLAAVSAALAGPEFTA